VVRWYAVAVGGVPLAVEELRVTLVGGICTVVLGATSPLPMATIRNGKAFLGISVDGALERTPKTELVPTAFTQNAAIADVARALSPEVTGLVTSLNEIAGSISLLGESGVRVRRDGNILRIGRTTDVVERGQIIGDNKTFIFRYRPTMIVSDPSAVTFRVVADTTTIAVTLAINTTNNEMIFRTSAPLLATETLEWEIKR